jgi:hypothetical protein
LTRLTLAVGFQHAFFQTPGGVECFEFIPGHKNGPRILD